MECRNHPLVTAVGRCTGCAEPFCENCLVEIHGQQYCGSCKVLALQGQAAPSVPTRGTCTEARDALIIAIIGLFCCAIILEPIALVKASKAKRMIAADPTLGGGGMATAAIVIAIAGLVLWGLGLIIRLSQMP
jgi:hydrogenase-4 membrane subunit HyfE